MPIPREKVADTIIDVPQASYLSEGDIVVCSDGSVGLLMELRAFGRSAVQFGASGPVMRYSWKSLRAATETEITEAGLNGVGRNPTRELILKKSKRGRRDHQK